MLADLKFVFRQLYKSPGFAAATILILALGIGGVTAIFSTLHTVMLQPLPYDEPDRLVLGRATFNGNINPWVAGPDYADYRDQNQSFSALEAFFCDPFEVTLTTGQSAERTSGLSVSTELFSTLGVDLTMGRHFSADEGRDGAPPVAIISYACWQRYFPGETDVTGHTLTVGGIANTIVGVMPPDFHFLFDVDVWFPIRPENLGPRRFNNWFILGRLKDGVTLAGAQSDIDVIAARLEQAYPDTNTNKGLLLTPLQNAFTEHYQSSFMLLGGGTAAILLIACANAAGLLLARGAGRQSELAVRAALGASQRRLMRLLLTEALVLATAAGLIGVVLATWIQNGLLHLLPIEALLLRDVGFSLPVLWFVIATTVITGLGFGLLPAWRARRSNLAQDLRSGGRGASGVGTRLRGSLVVGQVTISFVLLVMAGLLVRSLTSVHRENPGFNPRNLLTVEVPLPAGEYSEPERTIFFSTLLERARALPGVVSAAAISQLPVRDPYNNVSIYAAHYPPTNSTDRANGDGNQRVVLPGYFETMSIPLLAGRDIQRTDSPDSNRVVIISRQLAETLFPDRSPLGQHVVIDRNADQTWEVTGVVGDVKENSLWEPTNSRGTFYRAHGQVSLATMRLAIRTANDPRTIISSLRTVLQEMDPQVPLSGPRTMEDVVASSTLSEKAQSLFLTAFSLLAIFLATVGIHGLLAYIVAQRRRDIGIRIALGATRRNIVWPVLGNAVLLVLTGILAGGLGAFALLRLTGATFYGVGPTDPLTFMVAAVVLLLAAALAAWLPAQRATRVNPVESLRAE